MEQLPWVEKPLRMTWMDAADYFQALPLGRSLVSYRSRCSIRRIDTLAYYSFTFGRGYEDLSMEISCIYFVLYRHWISGFQHEDHKKQNYIYSITSCIHLHLGRKQRESILQIFRDNQSVSCSRGAVRSLPESCHLQDLARHMTAIDPNFDTS